MAAKNTAAGTLIARNAWLGWCGHRGGPMSCGRSCAAAITALILVLPVGGAAQAPVLPSDAASSTTPAQQKRRIPSHQYLDEAARVMTMIPETSFKGDGQKKLAELR